MTVVDTGESLARVDLERILVDAAKENGLRARVKPNYSRRYKLGSVQEIREIEGFDVYLNMGIIPAMRAYIPAQNRVSWFLIYGFPFGIAPKSKIKKYLESVSKRL